MTDITQPAGASQAIYAVGAIAQSDFPVPFQFDAAADLTVFVGGTATTAFTLTGTTETQGIYTAATVRLNAPVTNTTVVINRDTSLAQGATWPASGAFNVAALNREFARAWQALQDLDRRVERTMSSPDDEAPIGHLPPAASRAGFLLAFDAAGQPTLTTLSLNNQALSAIGQALAFAASQQAARAAIAAAPLAAPSFTGGATVSGGLVVDDARPAAVHGGPVAGFRNRVINGAMAIDQRYAGTQATITTSGGHVLDRWRIVPTGNSALVQRVAGATAGRFRLEMKRANANTSAIAATTRLEAQAVADLVGQRVTVSFNGYALGTSLRTLTLRLSHANAADNFAATTLIATGTASIGSDTLDPPITRVVWTLPNVLPAGAANGLLLSIETNQFLASGIQLEDVQLEAGTVATPFERRHPAVEQAMCQRYFETGEGSIEVQASGRWAGAVFFATPKRALPLVATATLSHTNLTADDATAFGTLNGFRARHTFSAAGAREFSWVADAEL